MFSGLLIAIVISAVTGQRQHVRDFQSNPYYDESPKPYSFSYSAPLEDGVGQSSRTESGDANGRVQGSYTINNDEGHYRIVEYVADENGFRANVRTNEPGTESKSPADVVFVSEAGPFSYNPVIRPAAVVPNPVLNTVPLVNPVVPSVRRTMYRRPVVPRDYQYRPNRYQNRRVYA
ncbi:hypothetical protein JTE90_012821 [Oedothorax gibbosus]|uniref:Cuticle protein n=1 Tax=Oedothorax gibbosus TaxID=931172 RepID=A0AAV6VXL8_9ARAC|nr:hypothetical protein JTE90_012821 [Oedothorax gibbosus]